MVKKRLQNRIATSRYVLPVTATYAALVWLLATYRDHRMWLPTALLALTTFLMTELNNQNALMRTYSRMVSCSFLMLSTACIFIFRDYTASIVQLSIAVCYLTLFGAYQDRRASGKVFTAFAAIGLTSVFFIQILFFVPVLWIVLATRVMAMGIRTFCGSLLGLITPYWFIEGYNVTIGKPLQTVAHFTTIAHFDTPFMLHGGDIVYPIIVFAFMTLVTLISSTHYLRTIYKDKIRTRLLYEALITMSVCCLIFIVIQPCHFAYLMPILIVSISPLAAHYITFTHTWLTNLSFYALTMLALSLTAFNLWMLL